MIERIRLAVQTLSTLDANWPICIETIGKQQKTDKIKPVENNLQVMMALGLVQQETVKTDKGTETCYSITRFGSEVVHLLIHSKPTQKANNLTW